MQEREEASETRGLALHQGERCTCLVQEETLRLDGAKLLAWNDILALVLSR